MWYKFLVLLIVIPALLLTPVLHYYLRDLWQQPTQHAQLGEGQAIVVLGAGPNPNPPRMINPALTVRVTTAVELLGQLHLPVLLTGGRARSSDPQTEAALMQALLVKQGFRGVYQESSSRNTWENAHFSAKILRAANIHKVILVSHAWHLRRAKLAFYRAGVDTIAYAVAIEANPFQGSIKNYLPQWRQLNNTWILLHEIAGYLYYRLV